jgi:hypothetical protein
LIPVREVRQSVEEGLDQDRQFDLYPKKWTTHRTIWP